MSSVAKQSGTAAMLKAAAISRKDANAFVDSLHRHHVAAIGDKYRLSAVNNDGQLVGVVQVGRPVARALDDGSTVEVIRCCTDGTRNACSFLYGRAVQVARLLGYRRIITYTLESESGSSLLASGFKLDGMTDGGSWSCKSRPRQQKAPTCPKKRWVKIL